MKMKVGEKDKEGMKEAVVEMKKEDAGNRR